LKIQMLWLVQETKLSKLNLKQTLGKLKDYPLIKTHCNS
jgi:hypothetical protein